MKRILEKKRFDFQKNMISRQSKQIDALKLQVDRLEQEIKEKDKIINAVTPLRNELVENVKNAKRHQEEYKKLIEELRQMKQIMNRTVYKNRWWLIKFLIK